MLTEEIVLFIFLSLMELFFNFPLSHITGQKEPVNIFHELETKTFVLEMFAKPDLSPIWQMAL